LPAPHPGGSSGGTRTALIVVVTLAAALVVTVLAVMAFLIGRAAGVVGDIGSGVAETVDEVTGEGPYTRVGEVTVESIRALAELTTVEMVEYTVVEKGDDQGWLNWAQGDRIEMFAVARIGAGVDLSRLEDGDVFADPETGRAIIRLPAADILYVEVDNQATHVYDRDTGLFTRGDPDLERAARLAAEEVLVEQAEVNGILTMAEDRSQVVLEDLLASLGYTDVDVVVTPAPPTD
jgi:hypothetical protein